MPDSIEIIREVHEIEISAPGPQGAAGAGVPAGGAIGQVLKKASATDYDTAWEDETGGGGGGVTDHGALTGLGDDDHPHYALADGSRGAFAAAVHTHLAADITDFTAAAGGVASAVIALAGIDDLADVTLAAPGAGEVLQLVGGVWVNRTLAEAGISAVGHAHAFAELTATPTTLAGYGITDAAPLVHTHDLADITDAGTAAAEDVEAFAAAVHSHDGADITSGQIDPVHLGTETPTAAKYLRGDGAWTTFPTAPTRYFERGAVFDGGGEPPSAGAGVQVGLAIAGTVWEAMLVATDDAGDRVADSCIVSVSKVSAAGAVTALGTISLTAAAYIRDTLLAGWTKALSAGDALLFELSSAPATATRVACTLKIQE